MKIFNLFLILLLSLSACQMEKEQKNEQGKVVPIVQKETAQILDPDYWYQGKAEVNAYDLQQSRYGEIHKGDAVLVFVTEDFLTDKQVKNDNYKNPNSVPILKTNYLKKFTTGIYDYSIMTSVFTPVEMKKNSQTLKVTTSSQDWCGHTFMQLNFRKNKYQVQVNSYFESEGDASFSIDNALLEDELFNRIRLNPETIPTGSVSMLPSTTVLRLMHVESKPQRAQISKKPYISRDVTGNNLQQLKINYPTLKRELSIVYEGDAPYKIIQWEDTYPSFSGKSMTSKATLRKTLLSDYWSKNGLKDAVLRTELGL